MKKILITGASGFIGSFIVEEALQKGMETWAAVRPNSSRAYLKDPRIHFIELTLSSQNELEKQLKGHRFDYVVHAAGVTKCLHQSDFFKVNTEGTKHLVAAFRALQMPLERFVYLSSLSVYGAIKEQQPYDDIRESDTPVPNTAYGKSKLAAECFLESLNSPLLEPDGQSPASDLQHQEASSRRQTTDHQAPSAPSQPFPYVILRPTGVYGPREKDYFLMAKSIKQHIDFAVGFKQQDITFVYVRDVVQAVFLALERGKTGRKYFLSDGNVYQSAAFSDLIRAELGRPWWIRVTAPVWLLRAVTFFGEYVGRLTGNISALNNDKYNILRQRNWRCDIAPAVEELGYQPAFDLQRGVRETINWYKKHRWL